MASVHDVAAYILEKRGKLDTWKLQKLAYYSQAWHTVWEGHPLFSERIEAWANGPVSPDLYRQHVGQFERSDWPTGQADRLTEDERTSIDAVLETYGDKTGHYLSALAHQEQPWIDARHGLAPGQRGNAEITPEAMYLYYSGL